MLRLLIPICLLAFAFKANKLPNSYTPYQVKIWTIKATEAYRPTWYPDGPGKYSIGLGYNDWGTHARRKEIAWAGPHVSYPEALKITLGELDKMKVNIKDPWVKAAFQLHIYNTGKCKSVQDLRGCCGASVGCGSSNKNVRKSHKPRRKLEYAMATHDFQTVYQMAAEFQEIAAQMDRLYQ